MSKLQNEGIINWLKATEDDAMGMESGDRAMAYAARQLILDSLEEIERLRGDLADAEQRFQFMSDQVEAKCKIIEALKREES